MKLMKPMILITMARLIKHHSDNDYYEVDTKDDPGDCHELEIIIILITVTRMIRTMTLMAKEMDSHDHTGDYH